MKGVSYMLLLVLLLNSCVSVEKYNANLEKPISVKEMHKDIRYAQRKLFQMHPDIDLFKPKSEINASFDSLVQRINQPLLQKQFFMQLSPVIASIRQGHTTIRPLMPKQNKEERKTNKGSLAPFAQFKLFEENEHYYITKDLTIDSSLKIGTELKAINGIAPNQIADSFKQILLGDGFNQSYYAQAKYNRLGAMYELLYGSKDTLELTLASDGQTNKQLITRKYKSEMAAAKTKDSLAKATIDSIKLATNKDTLQEANKATATSKKQKETLQKADSNLLKFGTDNFGKPLKELQIIDSQTAILTIKIFSDNMFSVAKNYKTIFETLKKRNIQNLIIDLRGNPGGAIKEIGILNSYITKGDEYITINPDATTTSRYKMAFWRLNGMPKGLYPIAMPFVIGKAINYRINTKPNGDGTFTHKNTDSKPRKAKTDKFTGNIYMITDGGTFSAASFVAANFKSEERGLIVGSETGGTYNGTVAGQLPVLKLKGTKMQLRIGTIHLKPAQPKGEFGRGVMPDVTIVPSLEDVLKGKDVQMDYIKKTIVERNNIVGIP